MPKVQEPVLEQAKIEARFCAKVDKGGPLWNGTPCWVWTGAHTRKGYGSFHFQGRLAPSHRVAYEILVAPIPAGLEIDHLCRNRACVNPEHMEAVTQRVNWERGRAITRLKALKTLCWRGHPLARVRPSGKRECSVCCKIRSPASTASARVRRALARTGGHQ